LVEDGIEVVFNCYCALRDIWVSYHDKRIRCTFRVGRRQILALINVCARFKISRSLGHPSVPDALVPSVRATFSHVVNWDSDSTKTSHVRFLDFINWRVR
jgi:hypothetical protein